MTGDETLVFAAAIAGVVIGLTAALLLSMVAVVGMWRFLSHASAASELVLTLAGKAGDGAAADGREFAELREQVRTLVEQQRGLQEMARDIIDSAAVGNNAAGLAEIVSTMGRLDGAVSQMAASLANLIELLERQASR